MSTDRSVVWKRVAWGAVVVLLVVLYFIFDPSQYGWFPKCLIYWATGYECPACGVQRMAHSLLHLDFEAALFYNPFALVVVLPLLLLLAISYLLPSTVGQRIRGILSHNTTFTVLLVLLVVWVVFRNTDFWHEIVASHI